jgi:hypothetical protein
MQQSLESANAEIAALAADLERLAVNHQEQVASLAARSVHIHQRFSS